MAMASKSNPKRLSELLKEQQEPFGLEVYLHERGCKITSLDFKGLHGRRKVKAWVLKVLPLRLKEWSFGDAVKKRNKQEKESCLSTEFNSFSETSQQNDEDNTDHKMVKWRMVEDSKQFSPISVLDEIELISNVTFSGQGIREHNHNHNQNQNPSRLSFSFPNLKKATEESIFSATLWELFIHKKEVVSSSKRHCSRHMKAKKQSRKLLVDYDKEAAESSSHGRQEFGNFRIWDKQSVNGMKINKLVRSEMVNSDLKDDELDDFREEIVKEVGDEILDEIVDEIFDLYFCKTQ